MDRISRLPEYIVHHILSFLDPFNGPPVEFVRMSVLSKTWFNLTASFHILDFSIYRFGFSQRESFFKYVEYTTSRFCHHNLPAHTFKLITCIRNPAELVVVNRCLELVLKNGVRELLISITYSSVSKYCLPNTLLSVSLLRSLTVRDCALPSSFMLDALKFESLIYLELANVHIDDEVIKYITTSCPVLQEFKISYCYGFKRFCVYGHQNLQNVVIDVDIPIEIIGIEAPNLTTLEVSGIQPPQMSLVSCKKLTSVSYNGYSNDFPNFLSNFPLVENLTLVSESGCKSLKLSSHSLRTLLLHSHCDLEKIELSTPNLGVFIYSRSAWYPYPEIRHLPHLKECMRCYPDRYIDARWFQKLRLFLDKKNGFKALNLYICTDQYIVLQKFMVLEKMKEIELPPYELEHIELHFEQHKESSDHAAFVDALLNNFRPRSLTLRSSFPLTDFEEQSALVKFTYEKLLKQENQDHINVHIVSPYSSKAQKQFRGLMLLPEPLPREEKAISFIKEEDVQEEAG
ncbi:putative F-box domain, leucine-rich repeat domain superfamily, F-box-like domain superfamily [Helianthus annuus]|uniref:F-box domain, leucine-rich repeat domain superfamily, F-box-like domain superfamily n=1 Tax=Helianthus annuus TaxID=4232 RepID=A0A251SA28_HELAN|nr:F-box/FBD/LRR-repeat protein At3g14710 [Helianthus annuus]XP_022012332.1 F-box/FBD/LRR-repeat protein At3g14710 [Helianthus annuus]KAF5765312.1 putative F-box domain, leucine-rich repeat domain superfamily, F-box-like domain superfamily [Helianthus annuus]KAJ0451858.1 putative F-box domain, leucine-rich repeat domain superfamily, F-box-like domain superfamily [Helianthus annuus]KAJ0456565.1 putative F-box domain, leucine-rich repeat domain superfamily, F-box-like domain superfamily [Helianth